MIREYLHVLHLMGDNKIINAAWKKKDKAISPIVLNRNRIFAKYFVYKTKLQLLLIVYFERVILLSQLVVGMKHYFLFHPLRPHACSIHSRTAQNKLLGCLILACKISLITDLLMLLYWMHPVVFQPNVSGNPSWVKMFHLLLGISHIKMELHLY